MTLRPYVDVCKGLNGPPVAFLVRALPIVHQVQACPGEFEEFGMSELGRFETFNLLKPRILNP